MVPTLEELREDLVRRWGEAFERRAEAEVEAQDAVETVFTEYPAFALSGYTPAKFKAGARVRKTPSADGDDYVFELDARGRPVRVRYEHKVNEVAWKGFYRYAADEVEHVEFCVQTGVPNLYNRLILAEGCVVAEQRFVCNGGGSGDPLSQGSAADKVQRILADPHAHFIYVTRYHVEGGVTRSGEEHQEVGGKIYRPTLEYSWAGGKLERILQRWPDGELRTVFAAKTKATVAELSQALSAKIAEATLAALAEARLPAPLVAVELGYRAGDRHIPLLIPITTVDQVDSLALASASIDSKRWIALAEEQFAPEIVQFDARTAENSSAAAKMLRNAARLVTERAAGTVEVADGFVAFAIDWELEGDQIATILKQCGAKPAQLKVWKTQGWI